MDTRSSVAKNEFDSMRRRNRDGFTRRETAILAVAFSVVILVDYLHSGRVAAEVSVKIFEMQTQLQMETLKLEGEREAVAMALSKLKMMNVPTKDKGQGK